MELRHYIDVFSSLHTAKVKGRKAPHKAVLLLAIIDLIEEEVILTPYIDLSDGLTAKQKQVLTAIALEEKSSSLMSQEFLQKYHLGASTVQGAVKTLLDRDFITQDDGVFQLCDKFLELSLRG